MPFYVAEGMGVVLSRFSNPNDNRPIAVGFPRPTDSVIRTALRLARAFPPKARAFSLATL